MRMFLRALFTPFLLASAVPAGANTSEPSVTSEAVAAISGQVDLYIRSIDLADTELASRVWAKTPQASFIHPRGHERGWDDIAVDFYGKTMGEFFTRRMLRRVGDLSVQVYGKAAVVEFDWDFVATRKDNGETLHTQGRETQVYIKFPKQGWRIVEVHYSGPAVTGAGQGF